MSMPFFYVEKSLLGGFFIAKDRFAGAKLRE